MIFPPGRPRLEFAKFLILGYFEKGPARLEHELARPETIEFHARAAANGARHFL